MSFRRKFVKIVPIIVLLAFFLVLNACSAPNLASTATAAALEATIPPTQTSAPVPTATPAQSVCLQSSGEVIDRSVPSELLPHDIPVKIYLPPCYDPQGTQRYPVLYMLHGQTYLDDQWVRIGLTDTADELIAEKRIAPLIIVMPQEDASTADPYTSQFGHAVLQEVIPYVDAHFDTCVEKACRAIGGLSRGGNWAVRLGLSSPQLFTAIGAHSTPLFYGDLSQIAKWVEAAPSLADVPVLYLDMGKSDENRTDILRFEQQLSDLGVVHDFYEFVGFHEEKYWSAHVEGYLLWYAAQFSSGDAQTPVQ